MRPRVRAFRAAHGVSATSRPTAIHEPASTIFGQSAMRRQRMQITTAAAASTSGVSGRTSVPSPVKKPASANAAASLRASVSCRTGAMPCAPISAPARRIERRLRENPHEHQQRERSEERRESFSDNRSGVARGERTQRRQPQAQLLQRAMFCRSRRNSRSDQRCENASDEINHSLREHHCDPTATKDRINRGEKCGIPGHSLIHRHQLPVDEQAVNAVVEPIARQFFVEFCIARIKWKMRDEIQPQRKTAEQRRNKMTVGNRQHARSRATGARCHSLQSICASAFRQCDATKNQPANQAARDCGRINAIVRLLPSHCTQQRFPGSSTVEHSAVNRRVASSNLARGAISYGLPTQVKTLQVRKFSRFKLVGMNRIVPFAVLVNALIARYPFAVAARFPSSFR